MIKGKIPTIMVLIILVLGIVLGVFLVRNRQLFRLGATGENAPKDVRVTNISQSTLTVSWTTDIQTLGTVKWGQTENSLGGTIVSETGNGYTHSATLTGLKPQTSYFFKINSSGSEFDNNGIAWEAQTASDIKTPTEPVVMSGAVEDNSGVPVEKALLYVTAGGGTPLSTVTSQEGNWVISVSTTRSQDLSSFVEIDEEKTLAEIFVQAGPRGTATALIYPQSAKPAPPIVLGQSHDFKNLPPSNETGVPQALLEVPQGQQESGFETLESTASASGKPVTIESIDEGEVVTTTEPEFFGEGPSATAITITIESEPQTEVVTIPSSGEWQWSPPEGLSPGPHKITISWRDASGILRTLTRNFVVQAADEPAFVSTPSATPTTRPTATLTPSPTPRLTLTPTPTPRVSPSATPSPTTKPSKTPTSTPSSLPDAGTGANTIAFAILGLALLGFSGLTFALSMNKNKQEG